LDCGWMGRGVRKRPNCWSMKDGEALEVSTAPPCLHSLRMLGFCDICIVGSRTLPFLSILINLQRLLPPRMMGADPEKEGCPPLQDFLSSHGRSSLHSSQPDDMFIVDPVATIKQSATTRVTIFPIRWQAMVHQISALCKKTFRRSDDRPSMTHGKKAANCYIARVPNTIASEKQERGFGHTGAGYLRQLRAKLFSIGVLLGLVVRLI